MTVSPTATVLFDGICNLCNSSVRTIVANDPAGYFRFAPLASDEARVALAPFGRKTESFASVVLVDTAGVSEGSDAALRIACYLRWPWPLFGVFFAVPRELRDGVYSWIARNRYRWFGKNDRCMLPSPEMQERAAGAFLARDGSNPVASRSGLRTCLV